MGWKHAFLFVIALSGCSSEESGAETASIRMDAFVAEAGAQGLMCQTFANPFGREVDVSAWTGRITRGGHHVLLFQVDDGEPGAAADCSGAANAYPVLFQSQNAATAELRYPEGVAAHLAADAKLLMQVHYLNAENEAITVDNAIELTAALPGAVDAHVASLMLQTFDIHVPPHETATATQMCTVNADVDVVWLTSHMHSHGIEFEAAFDDAAVYDSTSWEDPVVSIFEPLRAVDRGTALSFGCTYQNQSDTEVGFGASLVDDEMCVLVGAYTARGGGEPPTLACELGAGECLKCASAFAPAASGELCTDDGPPSSADVHAALESCACETGCADECGDSLCAQGPPSSACGDCMAAACSAELGACFGG
jgi:hypothetical protein